MTAVFSNNGLQIEIELVKNSDGSYQRVGKVYLDGFDVTDALRSIDVSIGANEIATVRLEAHLSSLTLDGKRVEGGNVSVVAGPTSVSVSESCDPVMKLIDPSIHDSYWR